MAATLRISDDLSCSVCLEIYDDPRQLTCGHTFCRRCIDDILNKGGRHSSRSVICPECRHKSIVGVRGAEVLTKNYTLTNIISKYWETEKKKQTAVLCSVCEVDRRAAVKRCQDCRIDYCQECLRQYHPQKGIFKKHILLEPVSKSISMSLLTISDPSLPVPELQLVQPLNSIDLTSEIKVKWDRCRGVLSYKIRCINAAWTNENRGSEEVVVRGLNDEDAEDYKVGGLRQDTEYIVTVTAMYPSNNSVASQPMSCRTRCQIESMFFVYSDDARHKDIHVGKNKITVFNKYSTDPYEKQKPYVNMFGIGASIGFYKPSQIRLYWEHVLGIEIYEIKDKEVVANVGVVEFRTGDNASTLTEHANCLCCSIYKVPGADKLAVKFWDGVKILTPRENIIAEYAGENGGELQLGFLFDFKNNRFTVVDVTRNVILHTFEKTGESMQPVVELFPNPNKIGIAVLLHTWNCITKLPDVLQNL